MKMDCEVSTEGRGVATVDGAGIVWGVFACENSREYRALTIGRGVSAIGREVTAAAATGEMARCDFTAGNRMSIAGVSSSSDGVSRTSCGVSLDCSVDSLLHGTFEGCSQGYCVHDANGLKKRPLGHAKANAMLFCNKKLQYKIICDKYKQYKTFLLTVRKFCVLSHTIFMRP